MGIMDTGPHGTRARILLVDDTELNRDLLGAILAGAGFAVDVAGDGETAWELTWSKTYDLVLMDLEMPGMSGFEAAARIRAREGVMSGVPIAALTATHEPDAELYSLWSGIDEYIAKPVEPRALVARIEAILSERHSDGDDWKAVWRLHAFAAWTRDLDAAATLDCLDELSSHLDEAVAAIHVPCDRLRAVSADRRQAPGPRHPLRLRRDRRHLRPLSGGADPAGALARPEPARRHRPAPATRSRCGGRTMPRCRRRAAGSAPASACRACSEVGRRRRTSEVDPESLRDRPHGEERRSRVSNHAPSLHFVVPLAEIVDGSRRACGAPHHEVICALATPVFQHTCMP